MWNSFLKRHFKKHLYIKFTSTSGVPQAVFCISILMLEKQTAQLYLLLPHHNIEQEVVMGKICSTPGAT